MTQEKWNMINNESGQFKNSNKNNIIECTKYIKIFL